MADRYFADVRVDIRVYFDDDGELDLRDQAVEALELAASLPDDEGECETGGIEVICIEKVRP